MPEDSSHLQHSMSGGEESKDRLQQTLHLIRMPSLAQLRHADEREKEVHGLTTSLLPLVRLQQGYG